MKIGLIVAIETDAIFNYYKSYEKLPSPKGFNLYKTLSNNNEVFILHAGMGEVMSSAGTQFLITEYKVDVIVNFGVVGGLTSEMKKTKTCVIDKVVHYKYDCSEFMPLQKGQVAGHDSIFIETDKTLVEKAISLCPELKIATCCSGDKFVGTEKEKSYLNKEFNGDVCDMESSGIVLTCEINNVPCLLLKAVSDGLTEGAKEFYTELKKVSFLCLQVADSIMAKL